MENMCMIFSEIFIKTSERMRLTMLTGNNVNGSGRTLFFYIIFISPFLFVLRIKNTHIFFYLKKYLPDVIIF